MKKKNRFLKKYLYIILLGAGSDNIVNISSGGLSAASITILYGYLAGEIVEAFMIN